MRLQFFIALRYLIAKKSNNIINWITRISVIVVSIVSCALIIILSAMNGLSDSVMKLYSDFDPDLKITPIEGKRIHTPEINFKALSSIPGIAHVVQTIEETVLLKYRDHQEVATLKGVTNNFDTLTNISNTMVDGFYATYGNGQEMCVLGAELALKLGVNVNLFEPVRIYVPNLQGGGFPGDFFKSVSPKPAGVFNITTDFNSKYILVSKGCAEELLEIDKELSAIEISIDPDADLPAVKEKVKKLIGPDFQVKTRFEQNEFLFKSINAEKWITLLILSLVVVLAVFNVVGSLTILIIDKKKDIYVLQSMGASLKTIRTIFWLEGAIISLFGSIIGLLLGVVASYLQNENCFFGYGSGDGLECFPINVQFMDVVLVFVMVNVISFVTSLIPVLRINSSIK